MFKHPLRSRLSSLRDTRGVSLLIVIGLTAMILMLATGAVRLVVAFMQTAHQVERANVAYEAAEAGIELALYDLVAYRDGYEVDPNQSVCGNSTSVTRTSNFAANCNSANKYRFINFTGQDTGTLDLSEGRGFWRLFARTLQSRAGVADDYVIPNPYFAGNKDGELLAAEWGELTKAQPISLSLLTDSGDITEPEPAVRFSYLDPAVPKSIVFDPGIDWNPNQGASGSEELMTWTFSAIDGNGEEYTLQGVVRESDFVADCGDGRNECFLFDIGDNGIPVPNTPNGDVFAGEDINKNLGSAFTSNPGDSHFNRVSGVAEGFRYATPYGFIEDLNNAMGGALNEQWHDARMTINLIGTLAETSNVASNSLDYKLVSDEVWADEYTYIISEGFAGLIKQTIETRFLRESTIPIFSYVIFQ
ncbi:MAG: hypothetical protein ABIH35_01705 [Patescibacteria group bacterium]